MSIKAEIKYGNTLLDTLTTSKSIEYDTANKYLTGGLFVTFDGPDDATATSSDILSGKTAYIADGSKATGTILSKVAETITPTTNNQTISSGQYLAGDLTILGDVNLVASNIKKDITIFGVTGTHQGGGIDPSDATADASKILAGYTAYIADGTKATGTVTTYDYSYTILTNQALAFTNCYSATQTGDTLEVT